MHLANGAVLAVLAQMTNLLIFRMYNRGKKTGDVDRLLF